MIGEIYEGMTVRSLDGSKLGKIERIGDGSFTIEKGLLNKERHEVSFSDVKEIRGGEAIVASGAEAYGSTGSAGLGTSKGTDKGAGYGARTERNVGKEGEVRVPLAEERLEAEKRVHEAGRIQVKKHVETEEKHIKVPVMREEVTVERVAATGRSASDAEFKDETFTIPVREEEVEVRKRPVVREEVRVATGQHIEEREYGGKVRREEAEVRTEGDLRGGAPRRDPNDRY